MSDYITNGGEFPNLREHSATKADFALPPWPLINQIIRPRASHLVLVDPPWDPPGPPCPAAGLLHPGRLVFTMAPLMGVVHPPRPSSAFPSFASSPSASCVVSLLLLFQLLLFMGTHALYYSPTMRLFTREADGCVDAGLRLAGELAEARSQLARAERRLESARLQMHVLRQALVKENKMGCANQVKAVADALDESAGEQRASAAAAAPAAATTATTAATTRRPPFARTPTTHRVDAVIGKLPPAPSLATPAAAATTPYNTPPPPLRCTDDDMANVAAGLASAPDPTSAIAAVVVVTHRRPAYLAQTLRSLLHAHAADPANLDDFPLYVSQDGHDDATRRVVTQDAEFAGRLGHLEHDQSEPIVYDRSPKENDAYYRIAAHYRWFLHQLFTCRGYQKVVILEEDMLVADDFFPYFRAGADLLDADDSLWCVSSWNDNGQAAFVKDPRTLYRSDFFPGLGWMLAKDTWDELAPKWPRAYWDDWMRLAKHRRGRQCIRPEVCRTYNIGEKGASAGQFYRRFLAPIRLNDEPVNWPAEPLSHLRSEAAYDAHFDRLLADATPVPSVSEARGKPGDVLLYYRSEADFRAIAKHVGIFDEWKDGIPRASYRGVVVFWLGGGTTRVFLAPSPAYV